MGCCGSGDDTGNFAVLKPKHGKGVGEGGDPVETEDGFGDEIYSLASDKAKQALKKEEDIEDKVFKGSGVQFREIQNLDGGKYKG